ncbi:MAG: flavin reductase family protein [Chloroflexota bacterium]
MTLRDRDGVCGVAADSFAMVSLDPLLILVSVNSRYRTHEQLISEGRFVVNVDAREQHTKRERQASRAGALQHGLDSVSHDLVAGLPALDDARAALACRVVDAYPAGDHTLIIGQVECMEQADDARASASVQPIEFTTSDWNTADWPAEMDFAC